MQVKFSYRGSILIVSMIGEIDHHSAEYLREKVDAQIIKSTIKNVIFDFSKVSFMDSSGIGVIMGRYKNLIKLNGRAAIVSTNEQISRIFQMSGILKLVPAFPTIDLAVKDLDEAI